MTTSVKIHVNGRYRAVVRQDGVAKPVEVHGNYEGSPNPSGEHTFFLAHGSLSNKFVVSEYQVHHEEPEAEKQVVKASDVGTVGDVLDSDQGEDHLGENPVA
jgi:hypothetical protein